MCPTSEWFDTSNSSVVSRSRSHSHSHIANSQRYHERNALKRPNEHNEILLVRLNAMCNVSFGMTLIFLIVDAMCKCCRVHAQTSCTGTTSMSIIPGTDVFVCYVPGTWYDIPVYLPITSELDTNFVILFPEGMIFIQDFCG